MSVLRGSNTNGDTVPAIFPNGQLPTPALSPEPEDGHAEEDGVRNSIPSLLNEANEGAVAVNGESKHQVHGYFALDGTTDSRPLQNGGTPGHDRRKRSIGKLASPTIGHSDREKVLKLSPAQIQELTHSPSSLPVRTASPLPEELTPLTESPASIASGSDLANGVNTVQVHVVGNGSALDGAGIKAEPSKLGFDVFSNGTVKKESRPSRPSLSSRTVSTPVIRRKQSSTRTLGQDHSGQQRAARPPPLHLDEDKPNGTPSLKPSSVQDPVSPPMPASIPLPPLSLPTYLQLELSSDKPSPLYIYRSASTDFPYESSKVKFERLLNFLWLAPQLEQVLWFGALACLDAWLYTFTILPLRFFKTLWVLICWGVRNAAREAKDLASFVYSGLGRVWRRRRQKSDVSMPGTPAPDGTNSRRTSFLTVHPSLPTPIAQENANPMATSLQLLQPQRKHAKSNANRHRRSKSIPSTLLPEHKADILKGLLVLASCLILMRFDASRMYHGIRAQAAIKLYVIYNVLEVCDRLFSALGQDIMECLLSSETLERDAHGRSKIIRPFWMFILALVYNVIHATALFYQVITLNVAVNSYSNALLTLLMSNQFVEIKGTVFKKFEKENLFQLTCADVVERFQLWLMLLIIALRNIVEVGGLSIGLGDISGSAGTAGVGSNATSAPFRSTSIIPKSFTILPKWTGQVLGPFLLVLGSEMLVDWLKHCYITKFNNTKPAVYGRFLDVLAKDYYSHAFTDQNLTKRLGLPLLPLSCLFIRALIQTYHMFLATHMPLPIPSTATSLAEQSASAATSPATTAALAHIDAVFRRALGRSSFGAGAGVGGSDSGWWNLSAWTLDDVIAFVTMLVVFLVAYLLLLTLKLVLGMALLSFARSRYRGMKERERMVADTGGKRVGGWGVVEVGEEKRRWIYEDDPEGARALREREEKARVKEEKGGAGLGGVRRYSMVAKRIW